MIARVALWPGHVYTWGTSEAERSREYPCDVLIPDPDDEMFRAVDVDAPPDELFLWICQLRLAPYSYDWIDNFGRRSPGRLVKFSVSYSSRAAALAMRLVLPPGDLIMMRRQLLNLKRLAEAG